MEICEGSAKIFLLESITVESENGWNGLGELPAPRRFMQEACFQTGQQAVSYTHLGNYANFLCDQRKDYDRAEEYYRRAVDADSNHANHLGNYANFLCDQRKDYDKAEEYYLSLIHI